MSEERSAEPVVAAYGSWKSPIGALDVAREAGKLAEPKIVGNRVFWSERRPLEGGRTVIVESGPDGVADLVPEPFNARSRVHEYGGGAYTVAEDSLFFCNFRDNRVYRRDPRGAPVAITPEGSAAYADLEVDASRRRLVAVREQAPESERQDGEPEASIVAIDWRGDHEPTRLVVGSDFYSNPRISPDGGQMLWLSWQHPNLPWDGTTLWLGELDERGQVISSRQIAGGDQESVFQPEWSPNGDVYFVSDRSGFWNLYRLPLGADQETAGPTLASTECLTPIEAELGLPQWVFGMRTYAFAGPDHVLCSVSEKAVWRLGRLEIGEPTGQRESSPDPSGLAVVDTQFTYLDGLVADDRRAVFLGAAPDRRAALVELDLETGKTRILRRLGSDPDPTWLSTGVAIEFPTQGDRTAHAFYYPPKNDSFRAPEGEQPPLLVKSHGGPTAAADNGYDPAIQFWTSRGFAVVDVNYGGSTGFGRAYRERLDGAWGIVDVDDCVAAAQYLAREGKADPSKLAIRGGSAGGYTTLAALAFRDVFSAGASHYGIGDLEALARDTHKFESRYLDRLVGPYPEERDLYRQRSPLHSADRLSCPVIFFQGLDDKIVPPNQAESMVEALRRKGVLVEYVEFAGEGHGFRKAENIAQALEAELSFYARVFGFSILASSGQGGPSSKPT